MCRLRNSPNVLRDTSLTYVTEDQGLALPTARLPELRGRPLDLATASSQPAWGSHLMEVGTGPCRLVPQLALNHQMHLHGRLQWWQ